MRIFPSFSAALVALALALPVFAQSDGVAAEWQVNSPALTIHINGVETDGTSGPAVGASGNVDPACPVPITGTFHLMTNLPGSIYEIALSGFGPKPGSESYVAPTGEIVNIDVSQPFGWLWGGSMLSWNTFGLQNFPGGVGQTFAVNIPFSVPGAGTLTMQGVVTDPSTASGFTVSQAASIIVTDVTNSGGGIAVAGLLDDNSVSVPLANPITFYGTIYNAMFVCSNGRVMFVAGDTDFAPSVADILVDNPHVGYFTDLSPQIAGTVTVTETGTSVLVEYNCIPYFGEFPRVNTYSIGFDLTNGDVILGNLNGINNPQGLNEGALCMSGGNAVLATDAGPTLFTAGGGGGHPLATDAYYDGHFDTLTVGLTPTLDPRVNLAEPNTIVFSLDGFGGYVWSAF